MKALARMSYQDWTAKINKPRRISNQLNVMLVRFPKPNPRIEANLRWGNSRIEQSLLAFFQVNKNVLNHIVVLRVILHRLRSALHVHRTHAGLGSEGHVQHFWIALQSRDIVNDLRAGIDCGLSDNLLWRYRSKVKPFESLDHSFF